MPETQSGGWKLDDAEVNTDRYADVSPDSPKGAKHDGGWGAGARDVSTEEFLEARNRTTRPEHHSQSSPEELQGHTLRVGHDGTVGYAVSPEGDIQNVFNNGGPRNAAASAIMEGVDGGARTLDCYDSPGGYSLPGYYAQFGFEETGRVKFDPQYAHGDLSKPPLSLKPDVVLMAWRGYPASKEAIITRTGAGVPAWRSHDRSQRYFATFEEAANARREGVSGRERAGRDRGRAGRGVEPSRDAGARQNLTAHRAGRHGAKHSAAPAIDVRGWTDAELLAFDRHYSKDTTDTSHEDPPAPGRNEKKKADTLFIAGALFLLMQKYQSKLQRAFDRATERLARLAEEGGEEAEAAGRAALSQLEVSWLGLAPAFLSSAYSVGADFAASFLGGSQLAAEEAAAAVAALVKTNAAFVSDSFVPAVRAKYIEVLASDSLTAAEAFDAVDALADSMGARVGMYSVQLWGAGHKGFADEMAAGEQLLEWVVTSGRPCSDCPELERGSPYGPDNPLPTFPGAGDTECLTNCLCLLRVWGVEAKGATVQGGGGAEAALSLRRAVVSLERVHEAALASQARAHSEVLTAGRAQHQAELEQQEGHFEAMMAQSAKGYEDMLAAADRRHTERTEHTKAAHEAELMEARAHSGEVLAELQGSRTEIVAAIKAIAPPTIEVAVRGPKRTVTKMKRNAAGVTDEAVAEHTY